MSVMSFVGASSPRDRTWTRTETRCAASCEVGLFHSLFESLIYDGDDRLQWIIIVDSGFDDEYAPSTSAFEEGLSRRRGPEQEQSGTQNDETELGGCEVVGNSSGDGDGSSDV